MKTQINLASHSQKVKKGTNKFTRIAIGILGISCLVVVSLLGYIYLLASQFASLDGEYATNMNEMLRLSGEKGKVIILEDRLSLINKILASRVNVNSSVQSILSVLPDSIGITSLDADSQHISLKISSENLAELNYLMQDKVKTLTTAKDSKFTTIALDSLSIDTNSSKYNIALTIQIKK